ncbi:universal stress protein [Antribacter sp. KLBMP9083]|uniref:Universal stress protein n=1 Tax=Antribacter soli TaxID=2910976 RepID=A0AA41QGM4_9MICO|nr:universal stress protein [Antribacter soli]MCF4123115.1 universal stress protein [Antribacter soli]
MTSGWYRGVVVGVDGSEESMGALDWAARTADRHDARLTVLSAYTPPHMTVMPEAVRHLAEARDEAQLAVDRAVARLGGARPGSRDVARTIAQGAAAHVLAQESRYCDLVVVGRRGLGLWDSALLGSVPSTLAAGAHGPVAVVPAGASAADPRRVVAGVSVDDEPVLELAFAEAQQRGCRLEVVHVVPPTAVLAGNDDFAVSWPKAAASDIGDQVNRWAEKSPEVAFAVTLRTGDPAEELLLGLTPDDLVVVGGGRPPAMLGQLMRSVPDAMLRRAPCAVVVIPEHHR